MLGGVFDMETLLYSMQTLRDQLEAARLLLSDTNTTPAFDNNGTMPLGVGLLPFVTDLDQALGIVSDFRPAIVWIFVTHEFADFGIWATRIRATSPHSKIWVQVGTVSMAVEVAQICAPDALIIQGSDAGGHGFKRGASIISLLPEAIDVLRANGFGAIPLIAAGGIVDGRGAAAALALGAAGIVMGTRFLAAPETDVPPSYREAVLRAKDGAVSTIRSEIFDNLVFDTMWPDLYNGRALVSESYHDDQAGVDIEKIRKLHREAAAKDDNGFGGRTATWAGAGVGLVNEVKGAADIVKEVRDGARDVIQKLKA